MTGLSGLVRADDLGAAVASALGRGEEPHHTLAEVKKPKKSLWPRTITEKKPLRLYVAGDSMDQVFGSSLVNLAEETGLVKGKNDYHVSSGLSRPDFYDWPQRLVDQIVDFRPDAAVVLFGANDGQDVLYEGKVLKVGTKAWQEVYARRVGEAMDILTKGGRRVYWVGNPIMKDFGYRERIAMMNHIYEAEAKKHPGVDVRQHLAGAGQREGLLRRVPQGRERRPGADARAGRHPPHARRRRPHGPGRARRDREGLGHDRLGVAQSCALTVSRPPSRGSAPARRRARRARGSGGSAGRWCGRRRAAPWACP